MVVGQGLVDEAEHGLGDLLAALQVVVAVRQDLGLDDRHDAVHLAHGRVAGEHVRVLEHRLVAGRVMSDLEHAAPLREMAAVLLVLGAALAQVVQTCRKLEDKEIENFLRCTFFLCLI